MSDDGLHAHAKHDRVHRHPLPDERAAQVAERLAEHPRYARADGVVFCQHAGGFASFDSDADYAEHLARDVVLPMLAEQAERIAVAIEAEAARIARDPEAQSKE